jgi:hypothetical protein
MILNESILELAGRLREAIRRLNLYFKSTLVANRINKMAQFATFDVL